MMQTHESRSQDKPNAVTSSKPVPLVKNSRSRKHRQRHVISADASEDADAGQNADAANTGREPDVNGRGGSFWGMLLGGGIGLIAILFWVVRETDRGPDASDPTLGAIPAEYKPDRAFGYLTALCDLGPRPSGSPQMKKQQELLKKFFETQGAGVRLQSFEIRHPETGVPVGMSNLIASWYPDRPKRFLFCAHYDTRPFPDRDADNPRGVFVGANDGASGVAALMELAHQFSVLPADVGVDIVLFDGEEFVFEQGRDDYFLGSTFFAEKYKMQPPVILYQAGVLLDMVGDRELKIYYERNSLKYARSVARGIWDTAEKLGVRAFVSRSRHNIDDDHIPLNEIARIPTVDLIDFDYPRPGFGAPKYWHTEQDIPANCSGESLAAVVWVVHQWLQQQ
ncbi:M28 family peptidase [Rubripirellula sp.]|jgi:glutaminyl-peptide cyclotransferase|nr:M28 family peptidase [Rubripirellula sp.]MDA9934760.1 M28 family peptidase [Rubripirellula sp.]MDB4634442.1 M28 family peptidase [Rubripirellula sp.]MDB4807271.1 M28 family peptidase [bacterium]